MEKLFTDEEMSSTRRERKRYWWMPFASCTNHSHTRSSVTTEKNYRKIADVLPKFRWGYRRKISEILCVCHPLFGSFTCGSRWLYLKLKINMLSLAQQWCWTNNGDEICCITQDIRRFWAGGIRLVHSCCKETLEWVIADARLWHCSPSTKPMRLKSYGKSCLTFTLSLSTKLLPHDGYERRWWSLLYL
jgi:hypothetical protein